jgi:hypothetical protein
MGGPAPPLPAACLGQGCRAGSCRRCSATFRSRRFTCASTTWHGRRAGAERRMNDRADNRIGASDRRSEMSAAAGRRLRSAFAITNEYPEYPQSPSHLRAGPTYVAALDAVGCTTIRCVAACCMLYHMCCMLYYVLHAILHVLHAILMCCMLYYMCCMLYYMCCMLHVACCSPGLPGCAGRVRPSAIRSVGSKAPSPFSAVPDTPPRVP